MKHRRISVARGPALSREKFMRVVEAAADLEDLREGQFFFRAKNIRSTRVPVAWLRSPSRLPAWAIALRKLFAQLTTLPNEARSQVSVSAATTRLRSLPLCIPLVRYFSTEFDTHCSPKLRAQLSSSAYRALQASLALRLLTALEPAAAARFKKKPVGSGPARAARRLLSLLYTFPVLARVLLVIGMDWQKATEEFLERLSRDRRLLAQLTKEPRSKFSKDPCVIALRPDLSDPHNRGRTVMQVFLSKRASIIYKPRSCRGEKEWERLIQCVMP